MGSFKEVGRLLNGVSLIAKEFVKRSEAVEAAKNGNLPKLIKKAIVSATDLSGLTKGEVRRLSNPSSSSNSDSVVHFATDAAVDSSSSSEEAVPVDFQEQHLQQPQTSSSDANNDTNGNKGEAIASSSTTATSLSAAENLDVRGEIGSVREGEHQNLVDKENTQVAFKRRKPRERRVPSTPFSRALGSVLFSASIRPTFIID